MYVGILVDTNRFKTRTGSRTFEAAAYLKNLGVDPITAENLLKEDFGDFEAKTAIMKYARQYAQGIIIAAVDNNRVVNRTLMSQVADSLLNIKDMEASFVIGNIENGKVAQQGYDQCADHHGKHAWRRSFHNGSPAKRANNGESRRGRIKAND